MVSRPPSVDALATSLHTGRLPRALLVEIARSAIEGAKETGGDPTESAKAQVEHLARQRPQRVINATGVLLHTNLGRAQIPPEAAVAGKIAAEMATPVEFDLAGGSRGGRGDYAHLLLKSLTGAEAALVVNNTAGALLLALAALAGNGSVVVSRGELIEIGGSFRLPELMLASGTKLHEVGTTNRTRLRDYQKAIGDDTKAILKVHPSNYRIEGFTDSASYAELGQLTTARSLPLIADIGSGLLDSRVPWLNGPPPGWLAGEPAVRQTLADGASLVLFSGDKLLGGPQAGIVVGRSDLVEQLRRHPIARAVRIAGPTLDSVAVTLEMYASGRGREIPFWRMATINESALKDRCEAVIASAGVEATVIADRSLPGAGTVPGRGIPGPVILVTGDGESSWRTLLDQPVPIVGRRAPQGLIIDLRAVQDEDDSMVASALATACR